MEVSRIRLHTFTVNAKRSKSLARQTACICRNGFNKDDDDHPRCSVPSLVGSCIYNATANRRDEPMVAAVDADWSFGRSVGRRMAPVAIHRLAWRPVSQPYDNLRSIRHSLDPGNGAVGWTPRMDPDGKFHVERIVRHASKECRNFLHPFVLRLSGPLDYRPHVRSSIDRSAGQLVSLRLKNCPLSAARQTVILRRKSL
jgi:hypothetical protein